VKLARAVAIGLVVLVAASACALLPQPTIEELPKPCVTVYSVARCQALTDTVAADIEKNRDDVESTIIVPDPIPKGAVLGGAWHILVRIQLKDGTSHDMKLCGGVAMEPACQEDPHLRAESPMGGYLDIPEGSTPLPSLQPQARAEARAITIERLSIPVDRLGKYDAFLGEGSLPNGVWSTGSFEFVDAWPPDLALRDGTAVLTLESMERDAVPFDNYFRHGWRPGIERIRAILSFEVLWFKPGATLQIRNIRVD
jgi:hypothetical protein